MISRADSDRFAALSGDFNPLHLDAVAARHMIFGATTPHGVHVMMSALDRVLSKRTGSAQFGQLRCHFVAPAAHDRPFDCVIERSDDSGAALRIVVTQDGSTLQTIDATLLPRDPARDLPVESALASREAPRDLRFEDAAVRQGSVALRLDRSTLDALFPALGGRLPAAQIAVLLAATRIVGMECPGLRSIFADLKLEFVEPASGLDARVDFRVARAEARMSLLLVSLAGSGAKGEITAFFRPLPVAQPGAEAVARGVSRREFETQRAVVIGGSRGLGEVTAKLLAMGGADVFITYRHGSDDAERVTRDISANGGRCRSVAFDVTRPPDRLPADVLPEPDWQATHVYYFASGPIQAARSHDWSDARFRQFTAFYLEGLARSFASLERTFPALASGAANLFYPSTVFIDKPRQGFAEYAAAKAAGEVVCRALTLARPKLRVWCPRLPPLKTDQTSTLRGSGGAADPLTIMVDLLRGLT